jgi:hypothetical protein
MKFTSPEGVLELKITGWQCPGATSGDGAYCLNVNGVLQHRVGGDWQFRGQYCTIPQLLSLAAWLDAVAAGEKPEMCMVGGFLNHELVFHVQGGSFNPNCYEEHFSPLTPVVFRVTFGGNSRPPWCADKRGFMDFPIVASELRAIALEFRQQIHRHVTE